VQTHITARRALPDGRTRYTAVDADGATWDVLTKPWYSTDGICIGVQSFIAESTLAADHDEAEAAALELANAEYRPSRWLTGL
jgi:hypothetical protein